MSRPFKITANTSYSMQTNHSTASDAIGVADGPTVGPKLAPVGMGFLWDLMCIRNARVICLTGWANGRKLMTTSSYQQKSSWAQLVVPSDARKPLRKAIKAKNKQTKQAVVFSHDRGVSPCS